MGGFMGDSNSLQNVLVMQPVMGSSNFNSSITLFLLGKDSLWNHNFGPSPEFLKLREASLFAPAMDANLIKAATDQLSKEAAVVPLAQAGMGWAIQPNIKDGGWGERGSTDIFNSEKTWIDK
jgi:ABC-type oligopeptide transport system substrate-binding subunit